MRLINLDNVLPEIVAIQAMDCAHNRKMGLVIMSLTKEPVVDAVEVVHGRWEPHMEEMEDFFGKTQLVQTGVMCSECGRYSCCGGNFCNNCGAKMDKQEENHESNES